MAKLKFRAYLLPYVGNVLGGNSIDKIMASVLLEKRIEMPFGLWDMSKLLILNLKPNLKPKSDFSSGN